MGLSVHYFHSILSTGLRSAGGAPYVNSLCRRGFVSESVYKLFSWGTFLPKIIFKVSADHVWYWRFAHGLWAQALAQSFFFEIWKQVPTWNLLTSQNFLEMSSQKVLQIEFASASLQILSKIWNCSHLNFFLPNWCLSNH